MKTTILGLRTCIYRVTDLQHAKQWYAEVFNTPPYFDEPFYVGFNIGGFELGLQPEEQTPAEKTDNVLCYWGVSNVANMYESLIQAGAGIHEAPQNVGGPIVVASVKDPWNNVLGIIYNPEFKSL